MSRIAVWLSDAAMAVAAMAVAFVSFAPQPVYALGSSDTGTSPAPTGERLQRAWAREQRVYERLGHFFDNADARIARAQKLIDRASSNGKDVSAIQAAPDAFSGAVTQARPIYEGGKGIIASHSGFDANGNVTDLMKALGTVQNMRAKLREIRQTIMPTVWALREAVREFRQANRPTPTATP